MLYSSFMLLKPSAAAGVDGVDWHEYANDLEANLSDLLERLKTHRYRAKKIGGATNCL
jgi:retron-type reverse transcriptase